MRLVIDRDVCIGSENCIRYAPGVFDLDDEGKVMQLSSADAMSDEVQQAVAWCPSGALTLDESK